MHETTTPALRGKNRRYRVEKLSHKYEGGFLSTNIICFRLSDAEKAKLDKLAEECSISRSQFIRLTALGTVPRSNHDNKVIYQISMLHADIGRVGGLLKLWLTRNEDAHLHYKLDVHELVNEIRNLKESINNLIITL